MPNIEAAFRPSTEQIAFFRRKLNIPTARWDDVWREHHAHGFMVAGVARTELLNDLRKLVDDAIVKGISFDQFQRDFESVAQRNGWLPKQGYAWRAQIIYDTNMRQSYNSGRWQQLTDPDAVLLRPYLQYRHSPESKVPRIMHKSWNGLVLRYDDDWWKTHAPQNGWRCRCSVRSLSRGELKALGKDGPDRSPDVDMHEWTDTRGVTHRVPRGIDPGFDYNVGMAAQSHSAAKSFGERASQLPPIWRARALADYKNRATAYFQDVSVWAESILDDAKARGRARIIGFVPELIATRENLSTLSVALDDHAMLHAARATKRASNLGVPREALIDPSLAMSSYTALFWQPKANAYAFARLWQPASNGNAMDDWFVVVYVRANYRNERSQLMGRDQLNWVQTLSYAKRSSLKSKADYTLIDGAI